MAGVFGVLGKRERICQCCCGREEGPTAQGWDLRVPEGSDGGRGCTLVPGVTAAGAMPAELVRWCSMARGVESWKRTDGTGSQCFPAGTGRVLVHGIEKLLEGHWPTRGCCLYCTIAQTVRCFQPERPYRFCGHPESYEGGRVPLTVAWAELCMPS